MAISAAADLTQDISTSNSLPDLAARIRAFHEATTENLRRSVEHAMAAGDLLIEAKALLKHGQWLPWLHDHCAISERTAQLYMRTAKNRETIETMAKSATVADLTLNETAALLMISSDVRKLLDFAKQADGLSGDALVEFCIANNVSVTSTPNYNPFAGRGEAEQTEWLLFAQFISYDREAGRAGYAPKDAWAHVDYLLQRPFQNVAEWLGSEGDRWRGQCGTSRDMTKLGLAGLHFSKSTAMTPSRMLTPAWISCTNSMKAIRPRESAARKQSGGRSDEVAAPERWCFHDQHPRTRPAARRAAGIDHGDRRRRPQ